jgi:hypothetical protein
MTTQRFLGALTTVNLALVTFMLTAMRPAVTRNAREPAPVLRGRALEIVDDQGRVRASISVLPASTSAQGDRTRETVLLRLITERGRPSVKIGASEETSGLSFAGPTGTRDTYVILQSKDTASLLRLRSESGREQVVRP